MRLSLLCFVLAAPLHAHAQGDLLYVPDPGLDRNVADLDYVFSQRRLTLAEGFELHASFDHIDLPETFNVESISTVATTLAYAINDRLEVGLATTFVVRPETEWGKIFVPRVTASLMEGEWSDVAVDIDTFVQLDDTTAALETRLGLPFRVRSGDWILLTGFNALAWNYDARRGVLRANVAVGYQLSETQAIRLDTQLFRLGLSNAKGSMLFDSAVPVGLSYFFSTSVKQDLNVTFSLPDASDGFDVFTFSLNSLSRF